jgi:hypothetical protein
MYVVKTTINHPPDHHNRWCKHHSQSGVVYGIVLTTSDRQKLTWFPQPAPLKRCALHHGMGEL